MSKIVPDDMADQELPLYLRMMPEDPTAKTLEEELPHTP
jgi:hypothetical protein